MLTFEVVRAIATISGPDSTKEKVSKCIALLMLAATPLIAQPTVPKLAFDSFPDYLKSPATMNLGEAEAVLHHDD